MKKGQTHIQKPWDQMGCALFNRGHQLYNSETQHTYCMMHKGVRLASLSRRCMQGSSLRLQTCARMKLQLLVLHILSVSVPMIQGIRVLGMAYT